MASVISNITEFPKETKVQNIKLLTFNQKLQKVNKIKYNLSLAYFAGLVVLMIALFI